MNNCKRFKDIENKNRWDSMVDNNSKHKNIYLRIPREKITALNRIIESYDNIGVVSTINAKEGLAMIQVTPDTMLTVREILNELSFVQIIE